MVRDRETARPATAGRALIYLTSEVAMRKFVGVRLNTEVWDSFRTEATENGLLVQAALEEALTAWILAHRKRRAKYLQDREAAING